MKNTLLFLTLLSVNAFAQTQQFYGANGQYQGQAMQSGNTTQFYGANGQYQGQAMQSGNTTQYYGGNGQYQGQTMNQAPAPVQNYGNQPLPQPYRSPSNRSSY